MSAATRLGIATGGFRGCDRNVPLAIATEGYVCLAIVKQGGKQYPFVRRTVITEPIDKISIDQLIKEDEELLALVVAGIQIGIIR